MSPFACSLVAVPCFIAIIAAIFYRKQNQGKWVGGAISVPKAMWLAYTIGAWFILPFAFLAFADLPAVFRAVLIFHLASWWIRGPLELIMIYKWLNWSPRYGIGHDLFHILGISTILILMPSGSGAFLGDGVDAAQRLLTAVYIGVILFSTVAEITFAALFFKTREKGDDLTYFASDDPRWRFINRLTATVVTIVYSHLFIQALLAVVWHL